MIRRLVIVAATGVAGIWACTPDQPATDPKTPANSPLPDIDKHDDDPKPGPKLPKLGDAG